MFKNLCLPFSLRHQTAVRSDIIIINTNNLFCRFNRASLLNVGFLVARKECDYIAMHDVDLLPLNKDLNYGYPEKGPFHVSGPNLHPKYHYKTFVGGILIMSNEQFEKVSGLHLFGSTNSQHNCKL